MTIDGITRPEKKNLPKRRRRNAKDPKPGRGPKRQSGKVKGNTTADKSSLPVDWEAMLAPRIDPQQSVLDQLDTELPYLVGHGQTQDKEARLPKTDVNSKSATPANSPAGKNPGRFQRLHQELITTVAFGDKPTPKNFG